MLRSLESKIAGLVEGTFSRAFKSEVRPVEIARKLARELDQNKVQSLSRAFGPNEYVVWLSAEDREQFSGYEDELKRELAGYVLEHARRERVGLLTSPVVEFRTDERLSLGEFGIQARLVQPPDDPAQEPSQGEHGHTMVYSAAAAVDPVMAGPPARGTAKLRIGDQSALVGSGGAVVGRSRDCDVLIDDPNVSRRHAELAPSQGGWVVRDLGSTNGVKVNGARVRGEQPVMPGDTIELGTTHVVFELE